MWGVGVKVRAIIVKLFSVFLNGRQRQLGSGPLLLDFTGRIHFAQTLLQSRDETLQDL